MDRKVISRAEWEKLGPAARQLIAKRIKGWLVIERDDEMGAIYKLRAEPKGRWVEYYSVSSTSDPSKSHVVAKDKNGQWGCDCPRWKFHREQCKHIQQLLLVLGRNAVVETAFVPETIQKALDRMARVEIAQDTGPVDVVEPASDRAKRLEV